MGCAGSAQMGSPEELKKSKFIDQELRKDKRKNAIKLLLLGAGESGKSTIAKQFSMINNCFTAQDFQQHKMIVHANAIDFAKILLRQLDKEGKQLDANLTPQKERILALQTFSTTFTPEIATDIKAILTSPLIQDALARRKDFGLPECSSYIFNKLDDIAKPDYLPSVEDCLHCRQRTSGVIETSLKYKDSDFTMVDVGGQRTERRKWIRCFEEVTVMLFVVALDEYDMTLMEDSEVNRMEESMAVLSDLSESAPLSKTPFIIFLNKKDLFEKKITKKDLTCLFPEYTGGCDYNGAIQFLREVYTTQAKNGNKDRALFIHETCAIDRQNIELVWQAMVQIITDQALKRANLAA